MELILDFIPIKEIKLNEWLNSFRKTSPQIAAGLGLSPVEIAQIDQLCKEYIDQIKLAYQLRKSAQAAVSKKKGMRKTHLGPLRKLIKKMKASPNYNPDSGAGMGVLPHKHAIDAGTFQPKITVRAEEDLIEIKFKKYGMDAMEFYGRPKDGEWKYLGQRKHSPFYYQPTNHIAGTMEHWEFTARAIKKDEQVGVSSNPVSVVYAPQVGSGK